MKFNAVKGLLVPMSDERFEASLRRRRGERRHEDSVTLEEVGLDGLAREAVAERDSTRRSDPTKSGALT
jgi:hypothetical protein